MRPDPAERRRGPGGREHERQDQQGPEQQQEPVPQAQPPLVLSGGIEEVAHRRKGHGRRFMVLTEMEQEGDGGGREAEQEPGVQESDHVRRAPCVRAARSATPNGVSVVIR